MFETILNNPGLQHLAENIFLNLDVEPLQLCGLLNKSSKQIFESPMFQNPMFWLRKFRQLSIDNQNDWANSIQSLNNYRRKYAIISYLRWNLKKGDMMDLRCYDSPPVQNYFRKFIRRICGCPLPRDLKQLIAVLRNPNSSQQEKDEVMSILNSNPSLMAAFIQQRQQAMMQQQQHGGQGGPQPLAAGGGPRQQQPGQGRQVGPQPHPRGVGCRLQELVSDSSDEENTLIAVKILAPLTNNPNAPEKYGITPIFYAARFGFTEIVKIIAPLTDNPNAPDKYGNTPIQRASQNGHTKIVLTAYCEKGPKF